MFKNHLSASSLIKNKEAGDIVLFRSLFNDLPIILLFSGGSILFTYFVFNGQSELSIDHWRFIFFRALLGLSGLLFCLSLAFRKYNLRYLISEDSVQTLQGFAPNQQIDARLEFNQIRGSEVHRTYFQHFIGTGDLHIYGSTSYEVQVIFSGISNPCKFDKIIQSRRKSTAK